MSINENRDPQPAKTDWLRPISAALMVGAGVLLFVVVGILPRLNTPRNVFPGENSAEVGFARDMMVHHAQAVELALLLYDRTDNPTLHAIALDIMLSQQNQIGQMQGWLDLWGRPTASGDLPMAWMGMVVDGLMPGMATGEQIADLRASKGLETDRQFIRLMIPHHESAIDMSQAIIDRTDQPAVRALAEGIIAAQQREIVELKKIATQIDETTVQPIPTLAAP